MRRVGAVPYAQAYYTPNIEEVQRSFVDKKKEWIRDLEQSADKVEQARISMQNNFVAKNNTSSLGMSASAYQKAMQPLRYTPEDKLIIQTLVSGLPSTQTFANYDPRVKLINFLSQFSDQFKIQQREELIRLLQDTVYYICTNEIGLPSPNTNATMIIATKIYNKIAGVTQAELAQPVSQALTMNAQAVNIGQLTPAQKKKILSNASFLFGENSLHNYIVKQIFENNKSLTQIGKLLTNQPVDNHTDPAVTVKAKTIDKLLLQSAIDDVGNYDDNKWMWRILPLQSDLNPEDNVAEYFRDIESKIIAYNNDQRDSDVYRMLEETSNVSFENLINDAYGWIRDRDKMKLATTFPYISPISEFTRTMVSIFNWYYANYTKFLDNLSTIKPSNEVHNTILKILRKLARVINWPAEIHDILTESGEVANIEFDKKLISEVRDESDKIRDMISKINQLTPAGPSAPAGPSSPTIPSPSPVDINEDSDSQSASASTDQPDNRSLISDDASTDIGTPNPTGQGLGKKLNKALSKEIGKIDAYKAAGGNNSQTMTKAAILRRMLRR